MASGPSVCAHLPATGQPGQDGQSSDRPNYKRATSTRRHGRARQYEWIFGHLNTCHPHSPLDAPLCLALCNGQGRLQPLQPWMPACQSLFPLNFVDHPDNPAAGPHGSRKIYRWSFNTTAARGHYQYLSLVATSSYTAGLTPRRCISPSASFDGYHPGVTTQTRSLAVRGTFQNPGCSTLPALRTRSPISTRLAPPDATTLGS